MSASSNTPFVVLTTNRSGSVWLMSTLNSFDNVNAQGELFLPRPRAAAQRWDSDFARPRYIEARRGVRPFSVFTYLNELYALPGVVGFKLMYAQLGAHPEILAYLLWRRVRVVHLVRRNHLDTLLSFAVKAKLGQAHILAGQAAPDAVQVELDTASLLGRLERLQRKQRLARLLLRGSRLRQIEVVYEDLAADPANFEPIWSFLKVGRDSALPQSPTVRSRRGGQREVISNYQAVCNVLRQSKYSALLD